MINRLFFPNFATFLWYNLYSFSTYQMIEFDETKAWTFVYLFLNERQRSYRLEVQWLTWTVFKRHSFLKLILTSKHRSEKNVRTTTRLMQLCIQKHFFGDKPVWMFSRCKCDVHLPKDNRMFLCSDGAKAPKCHHQRPQGRLQIHLHNDGQFRTARTQCRSTQSRYPMDAGISR